MAEEPRQELEIVKDEAWLRKGDTKYLIGTGIKVIGGTPSPNPRRRRKKKAKRRRNTEPPCHVPVRQSGSGERGQTSPPRAANPKRKRKARRKKRRNTDGPDRPPPKRKPAQKKAGPAPRLKRVKKSSSAPKRNAKPTAKKKANSKAPPRKNVEMGFWDDTGFHPIRASSDYDDSRAGSYSRSVKSMKRRAKATHAKRSAAKKRTKALSRRIGR